MMATSMIGKMRIDGVNGTLTNTCRKTSGVCFSCKSHCLMYCFVVFFFVIVSFCCCWFSIAWARAISRFQTFDSASALFSFFFFVAFLDDVIAWFHHQKRKKKKLQNVCPSIGNEITIHASIWAEDHHFSLSLFLLYSFHSRCSFFSSCSSVSLPWLFLFLVTHTFYPFAPQWWWWCGCVAPARKMC